MRRQRFGPAFLVIAIMLVLIGAYVVGAYSMVKPDRDRICQGVYVEKVDLSGMTREEAQGALTRYVEQLSQRTLVVDVNGEKVTTTLEDIGYTCEPGDAIDMAMVVGKEGNLFTNYARVREVAAEHVVYSMKEAYSDKKLKKFVKNICGKKCANAKNATIKRENGKFVYTKARQGVSLEVDGTVARIKAALSEQGEAQEVNAEAIVTVQEPVVSKKLASRCKDKIGSFSTNFNAGNVSRSKNVANAARLINAAVINPGETFSVHDAISPMTEDNGYYAAPSYNNGEVVDSIGGGVCQVSTTLYNAVLHAELEVVERSPHSMVVAYVEPSMDAAIAGDYKDFKFRNNTDVPIYIEGGTTSGTVYFRIYGEETRDVDRKVEYVSETIETIQPDADKITYDKTKPASYTVVTQEAHIGYKAVLWKIVTENGESTKTQVNSSTYKAEPRYVTKGSAGVATPKASDKPKTGDGSGKGGANDPSVPKATAKPKETAKPKATKPPAETEAPKATDPPVATAVPVPPQEDGGE